MKDRVKRVLVSMFWGGAGVLFLVLFLRMPGTPVLASQDGEPQAVGEGMAPAPSGTPLSLVIRDEFDGTFTETYHIQRQITSTGEYMWGRVLTSTQEFTDTLWCVQGGEGISLTAGVDTYTDGVETVLAYGPVNFQNVVTAELSFERWISVADGDGLEWGYSTDGVSFTFAAVPNDPVGDWHPVTLTSEAAGELAPLLGERHVYFAFRFRSDDDGQVDRGVFLDNVQLQAGYDVEVHLPFVPRSFFEAYVYEDNFEDWGSGWPYGFQNLGSFYPAAAEEFSYGYLRDSERPDPDTPGSKNVYYIWVRDNYDHIFLTGPKKKAYALKNFRYEVSLRLSEDKRRGDEYGILVSPVPINPKDPSGAPVYTLQIRLDGSSDRLGLVRKWEITNAKVHPAKTIDSIRTHDFLTDRYKRWNRFKIEREGNTLKFYVTSEPKWGSWAQVATHDMTADFEGGIVPDKLYVGFYAAHTGPYSYNIDFQFDNVYLYSYP